MPTASTKNLNSTPAVNMPDLLQEPIKNMVCVLDKKLRNLEKRKLKLVETKKKADDGSELNEDQKKALENLILVENSLATVKEVHKTLGTVEQEYTKLLRKDQKRTKQEQKEQFEVKTHESVSRTIQIQAILGELNEEVRPDFLSGSNGACELTEDELGNLDSFYELINVSSENKKMNFTGRVSEVAMHIFSVIESKDEVAFDTVTYQQISEILTRVQECGYFDKEEEVEAEEEPEVVEEEPEVEEVVTEVEEEEPLQAGEQEEEEGTEECEQIEVYTESNHVEEFPSEGEPEPETFIEPVGEEELTSGAEEIEQPEISIPETNGGVDLPPEVLQVEETPDDQRIDFLGESEISTALLLEAQQQSLNPVSPEFIPRNLQPVEENGWVEPASAPTASTDAGWTESPSGDNSEWQANSDFSQTNGGDNGYIRGGRGRGGRSRSNNTRGFRGSRGFRGGRQGQEGNYREGGNYRGRGNRGNRGGENNRGGPRGRRGDGSYRGNDGNRGRGNFGGGGFIRNPQQQ